MKIDSSDIINKTDDYIDVYLRTKYFSINQEGALFVGGILSSDDNVFEINRMKIIEVDYNVEKNCLTGDRNLIMRLQWGNK